MRIPFIETLDAYTHRLESGETLSGTELAECLALLAAHEVAEGGPYASCTACRHPDMDTNIAVARFLEASGAYLPNLHAFLARELSSGKHPTDGLAWMPHDAPSETAYQPAETLPEFTLCLDECLKPVSREIAGTVRKMLTTTMARNQDGQMTRMPLYMREALGSRGAMFSNTKVAELGVASAFFWTSFIAYDDFWDEDEAADPLHLPAANFMARHFIRTLTSTLPNNAAFTAYVHGMMDRLDAANAWEVAHCRMKVEEGDVLIPETLPAYEDFSIKFYPAAGQCLAPVLMMVELGYEIDGPEITALVDYFTHYLVAMQLNDDMHDWKEDLARGHISTAVAVLLLEWKRAYPERAGISLAADENELEELFWERVVDPLCTCVLERAERSRAALTKVGLENPEPLVRFIDAVEGSARHALQVRATGTELVAALSETS